AHDGGSKGVRAERAPGGASGKACGCGEAGNDANHANDDGQTNAGADPTSDARANAKGEGGAQTNADVFTRKITDNERSERSAEGTHDEARAAADMRSDRRANDAGSIWRFDESATSAGSASCKISWMPW